MSNVRAQGKKPKSLDESPSLSPEVKRAEGRPNPFFYFARYSKNEVTPQAALILSQRDIQRLNKSASRKKEDEYEAAGDKKSYPYARL